MVILSNRRKGFQQGSQIRRTGKKESSLLIIHFGAMMDIKNSIMEWWCLTATRDIMI